MSVVGAVYGVAVLAVVVWYTGVVWKATDSYFKEEFTKHLQESGARPRPVFTKHKDQPRPDTDQRGLHVLEVLHREPVHGPSHSRPRGEGLPHPGQGSQPDNPVQGRLNQNGAAAQELAHPGQAFTQSSAGLYTPQQLQNQQEPIRQPVHSAQSITETPQRTSQGSRQANLAGAQPDPERDPTHLTSLTHSVHQQQERIYSAESHDQPGSPHQADQAANQYSSELDTARHFQAESNLFLRQFLVPEPSQHQAESEAARLFKTKPDSSEHRAGPDQASRQYHTEPDPTRQCQDESDEDEQCHAKHVTAPRLDQVEPEPPRYQAKAGNPQPFLTQSESCLHSSDPCPS